MENEEKKEKREVIHLNEMPPPSDRLRERWRRMDMAGDDVIELCDSKERAEEIRRKFLESGLAH